MVRPLPQARAHDRRDRPREGGLGARLQARRRRQSRDPHEIRDPRQPDRPVLQGRPARRPAGRSASEGKHPQEDRAASRLKEFKMSTQLLFSPVPFGRIQLKNRVVMAPLTRSRAIGNVPNDLMALYYSQRAGAGLIITEGTSPSPNGLGYARIPGLFSQEQADGWRKVTERVHEAGGRIFVQLMHTGRVSHLLNLPKGARVLAP